MIVRSLTVGQDWTEVRGGLDSFVHTVFLAGPIERVAPGEAKTLPCWRDEAMLLLNATQPDLVVFNPEWPERPLRWSYDKQVEWEVQHMHRADTVLFWIPRSPELPAFTTNIEFGEHIYSDKIVVGSPPNATHMKYLRTRCEMRKLPWHHNLADCCTAVTERAKLPAWLEEQRHG